VGEDDDRVAALDEVRAELVAREPIFHRTELGTSREDYLAQTAEDYWEVGASGRVYERQRVVSDLVARGKVPGDESWVVSDARVRQLGETTYALTYQLDQAGRLTRRLTLWDRDPGGWKILYHQGTIIQDPCARGARTRRVCERRWDSERRRTCGGEERSRAPDLPGISAGNYAHVGVLLTNNSLCAYLLVRRATSRSTRGPPRSAG
jgi:hypothetical protein